MGKQINFLTAGICCAETFGKVGLYEQKKLDGLDLIFLHLFIFLCLLLSAFLLEQVDDCHGCSCLLPSFLAVPTLAARILCTIFSQCSQNA